MWSRPNSRRGPRPRADRRGEPPCRTGQRRLDRAPRRVARRGIGGERRPRIRGAHDEIDLVEECGHLLVQFDAQQLGPGGSSQVVERLGQPDAGGDLVGHVPRARRPAVAQLGEQRRGVSHHPVRDEVRKLHVDVDPDEPGVGDQEIGLRPDVVLHPGVEDDPAEIGDHRHAQAAEVVAAQTRLEAGMFREDSSGHGSRSRRRRRSTAAASRTDRARLPRTTVFGRLNAFGLRGIRPNVPFMPEEPGVAGRDPDRPAAITTGGEADEPARNRSGRTA